MTRVLVDLTRATAVPHVYAGANYHFAIRGLMQIAAALARAGCVITLLADPDFVQTPPAAQVLASTPSIQSIVAENETAFPRALDATGPDACVMWNGCHLPHVAGVCRDRGAAPIFAEAGWFERERSAFLDGWGVMVGSSLSEFLPEPGLSDQERRARLEPIARTGERQRLCAGDYLLVLLDAGNGWTYFDRRHSDPLAIVRQLRAQFPDLPLAVRPHPTERERVIARLPKGAFDAGEGALLDWAAHCTAAVGASSKAVFAPALFGRPSILIGGSVASGKRPHPAFAQRNRIAAITEADLLDRSRCEQARAFVYEAVFHRHVFFDGAPPLAQNRVLAPLLG